MKSHTYHYDQVVIGSELSAVLYAFLNNLPLIFNRIYYPKLFEKFSVDVSKKHFSSWNYEIQEQASPNFARNVGIAKADVWSKTCFLMSLAGLLPLGNMLSTLRVDGNQLLLNKGANLFKVQFNKLFIFDDDKIQGLEPPIKSTTKENFKLVIDWFNVRSGTIHPYDFFVTDENFVNEVVFYPSLRIDGNNNKKDLAALSYMNQKQLGLSNYSDTYVKFKIVQLMKNAGIRGARQTGERHLPIKIESTKREVLPIAKNIYKDTENITFFNKTDIEVLNDNQLKDKNYLFKLNGMFDTK